MSRKIYKTIARIYEATIGRFHGKDSRLESSIIGDDSSRDITVRRTQRLTPPKIKGNYRHRMFEYGRIEE